MAKPHGETIQQGQKRGSRWRKIAGVAIAFLIVCGVGGALTYRHFTNPERIRKIAEAVLQRYSTAKVSVGSASVTWQDGVRIFDVKFVARNDEFPGTTLVDPGDENARSALSAEPVFSCREIRLVADRKSVFMGSPDIETVIAIEPKCTIVRDRAAGRSNMTNLLRLPERVDRLPRRGPTIELRDARIRVVSVEDGGARLVEDLRLTIRARPAQDEPDTYDVAWHDESQKAADGYSKIDLRTGRLRNVQGGLPWMSIEAVMAAIDVGYEGVGAWSDLLGLAGTVRAKDYNLPGAGENATTRSATIELTHASISIPIGAEESDLPPEERYLRFVGVEGEVVLAAQGIRAEFSGLFHGARCEVSASFRGDLDTLKTLDDVDFDVAIQAKGIELPGLESDRPPHEARFINRLAKLKKFYDEYDPHGLVDLEVEVAKRAGADQPILARRIILSPRGADMSYWRIPYRVRQVYGVVEYTTDGVRINNLRGTHGDGVVTVNGYFEKPLKTSAKILSIRGEQIRIDDDLYAAMPVQYRKPTRMFSPSGFVDVNVELTQDQGTVEMPEKWQSTVLIMLRDVSAKYAHFPYPIDHLTGTLEARRDRLKILDVVGNSGRASIEADGEVLFSSDGIADLSLTIRGQDVAIDSTLTDALSPEAKSRLAPLHASGVFDVLSTLSYDPDRRRVNHRASLALRDVAIRHDDLPVDFTDIRGGVELIADRTEFKGLRGKYKGASVAVDGFVGSASGVPAVDLTFKSTGIELDDELRAALPARVRSAISDWTVSGPTKTTTHVSVSKETDALVVSTTAEFLGATLRHTELPAPLEDVRGTLVLDDRGMNATNIEGSYGPAKLSATFDVGRTPEGKRYEEGAIKIVATGATLDDSVRSLFPKSMESFWDRYRPRGSVDVSIDALRFEKRGDDLPREWTVAGYVEFNDVTPQRGTSVGRMSGTIIGSGALVDKHGGTALTGNLALSSFNIFDQPLTQAEGKWSFAHVKDGEGVLALESLRGRMHDGTVTGSFKLAFGSSHTEYDATITLHDMQIEPFVHQAHAPPAPDAKRIQATGLLDGHLFLSGTMGNARTRRGRGRFEIRDGEMYRLPVVLALVQVLNLAIPEAHAFDHVKADFFIVGDRVQFSEMSLRSNALALIGTGTLMIPDRGVDLDLVNVSPHSWARMPILAEFVEGASRELMELHVTGPLSRPTVRARPLRALSEEFKRLFRRKGSKKELSVLR